MKNQLRYLTKTIVPVGFVFLLALVTFLVALGGRTASAQAPAPASPAINAKAHALLSKLTLEQKILLTGGVESMFTNAVPSINLPRLKMSDASVGVRTWGPTTAYAGGAALAATWVQPSPANSERAWARTPVPAASTS